MSNAKNSNSSNQIPLRQTKNLRRRELDNSAPVMAIRAIHRANPPNPRTKTTHPRRMNQAATQRSNRNQTIRLTSNPIKVTNSRAVALRVAALEREAPAPTQQKTSNRKAPRVAQVLARAAKQAVSKTGRVSSSALVTPVAAGKGSPQAKNPAPRSSRKPWTKPRNPFKENPMATLARRRPRRNPRADRHRVRTRNRTLKARRARQTKRNAPRKKRKEATRAIRSHP